MLTDLLNSLNYFDIQNHIKAYYYKRHHMCITFGDATHSTSCLPSLSVLLFEAHFALVEHRNLVAITPLR